MLNEIYLRFLDRSISNRRDVWLFVLLLPCFIEIPVFNANSLDTDQTTISSISFLPVSGRRHKMTHKG